MVRQVRQRLNAVSAKQGRPMILVVRVPPAMHNCAWSGLDVADWMKQRIVDVVIPAQLMTLAHDMPVDEFARLANPAGVQVFGSIYGRCGYNRPFTANHAAAAYAKPVTRRPDAAQVLGSMLNQRYLGAAGFQLYNFYLFDTNAPMTSAVATGLANTPLGDRRYQVTQSYYLDREDSHEYRKQLPAVLKPGETASAHRRRLGEGRSEAPLRRPALGSLGSQQGLCKRGYEREHQWQSNPRRYNDKVSGRHHRHTQRQRRPSAADRGLSPMAHHRSLAAEARLE